MKIFGKITGYNKLVKSINDLQKNVLEGQIEAVAEATLLIHETAVKSIRDNSDGKSAIRYNPKRVVNVSKPGDPPNADTGRLMQSIKFDFKKNGTVGRVGSNLKYAAWLEFGTLQMDPRPWLEPAVRMTSGAIGDIFNKNVKKAIKGST